MMSEKPPEEPAEDRPLEEKPTPRGRAQKRHIELFGQPSTHQSKQEAAEEADMHEAIPPLFPPQNSQTLLDAMQMVFFGARLNPSEEAKVRAALDRYMHEEKPTIEHVLSRRVQILMLTFLLDGKELTEQSRDEICTQAIEHSAIDTSDFIPEDLYDAYDHSLNVFLARKYIRPNEPPRRTDQDEADGEGLAQ